MEVQPEKPKAQKKNPRGKKTHNNKKVWVFTC
jgi:hypothetical protein